MTKVPGGMIDSSGDITITNLTVTGDLSVTGTTTSLETATLNVEDKNIVLNYGSGDTSASADGAGITIQDAVNSSTDASITWDASNDKFNISHKLDVQGTSSSSYSGNGPGSTLTVSQGSAGNWISSEYNGMFAYFGTENLTTAKFAAYNYNTSAEGNMVLGQDRMYIKSDGFVGIGNTDPAKPLHITSSDIQPLRVESTGAYSGVEIKNSGSSTLPALVSTLGDGLLFYTGHASSRLLVAKFQSSGKSAFKEIEAIDASLEIGNGDEKQIFDGVEETIEFQTADAERMRITNSGVTYATNMEVRQHYATDNNSYKRYTAPLNPKIVETGLQLYVDPTRATDGTDFSPASYGNGNQDLTLGSGTSWGSNANRSYWTFDGSSNAGMYGNPNLSAGKACSFSYWLYINDVNNLSGGYHLSGIQKGNHYMYLGVVQGNNDSAPLYGYVGQGTNIPQGGGAASHEQAYINSDEWVYLTIQCGHGTSSLTSRSRGRAEVYVNGSLVQRRNEIALPTVAASGSTDFWLGRVSGGYYLSGLIGPAVVYERMLHQWEILENMRVHADMYVI